MQLSDELQRRPGPDAAWTQQPRPRRPKLQVWLDAWLCAALLSLSPRSIQHFRAILLQVHLDTASESWYI